MKIRPTATRSPARLLICCLLAMASGCTTMGGFTLPGFPGTEEPAAGMPPTGADLARALREREEALADFRGQARLKLESADGRFRSSQMILVRSPESVRIDVLHPFGVAYTLATDGSRLRAYDRREKVLYEGAATSRNIARFSGVPLAPWMLARLVRGLPPVETAAPTASAPTASAPIGEAEPADGPAAPGGQVLAGAEGDWLWYPDGGGSEVTFDRATLVPLSVRLSEESNGGSVTARFGDYQDVQGVPVAHKLSVELSDGGRLELKYDRIWREVSIGDGAFRVDAPAGVRSVNLDVESVESGNGESRHQ